MDDVTERLARYATGFDLDAIAPSAREAMIDHLVDAAGCALAGADEAPCRIARALAAEARPAQTGASALGLQTPTTPELAAFANATAIRCLDFNDTYNGRTGGHPSDMIPGVLAAAEETGRSGADVLSGAFVAYEAFAALADQVPLRESGFDQGVLLAPACAAGIATALGLGVAQAANAIAIALTSSVPLRVTRSGALTAWKGCATPHAVMNAVLAARLAARGMTGPERPFDGVHGFHDQIYGPVALDRLGAAVDGRTAVERTAIKFLPVEWCAQAPVELFLRLRSELDPEQIVSIEIGGYDFLVNEIGGGRGDAAEKWDPQSRETADHSLAYALAVALTDGAVTLDSFTLARVRDPALRPLMRKITVFEAPEAKGAFPPRMPVTVTITRTDGRVIEERCAYPVGHPTRPGDRDMIDRKFRDLAGRALGTENAERLLATARGLAEAPSLDALAAALRAVPVAT